VSTLGNGLPDLPPEWGEVLIPDDAAELEEEATRVRKELRRDLRRAKRRAFTERWRRRLHLPPRIDDPEEPSLFLPMLVLGVALLITLLSLLMIAWPNLIKSTPERVDPGPSVIQPS
jgi:hypothetical protein